MGEIGRVGSDACPSKGLMTLPPQAPARFSEAQLPAGLRVGSGLLLSVRELYCLQPRPDRLWLHLSRALPTLPSHADMHRSTFVRMPLTKI